MTRDPSNRLRRAWQAFLNWTLNHMEPSEADEQRESAERLYDRLEFWFQITIGVLLAVVFAFNAWLMYLIWG